MKQLLQVNKYCTIKENFLVKYLKKGILIFIVSLNYCCTGGANDNKIQIFNRIHFEILDNEKVLIPSFSAKAEYFEYLKKLEVQAPLFKCIENEKEKYRIYIGIPYDISYEKIMNKKVVEVGTVNKVLKSDSVSFLRRYTNNSDRILEYARKDKSNIIYVLILEKGESLTFNHENISARFKIN